MRRDGPVRINLGSPTLYGRVGIRRDATEEELRERKEAIRKALIDEGILELPAELQRVFEVLCNDDPDLRPDERFAIRRTYDTLLAAAEDDTICNLDHNAEHVLDLCNRSGLVVFPHPGDPTKIKLRLRGEPPPAPPFGPEPPGVIEQRPERAELSVRTNAKRLLVDVLFLRVFRGRSVIEGAGILAVIAAVLVGLSFGVPAVIRAVTAERQWMKTAEFQDRVAAAQNRLRSEMIKFDDYATRLLSDVGAAPFYWSLPSPSGSDRLSSTIFRDPRSKDRASHVWHLLTTVETDAAGVWSHPQRGRVLESEYEHYNANRQALIRNAGNDEGTRLDRQEAMLFLGILESRANRLNGRLENGEPVEAGTILDRELIDELANLVRRNFGG